MCVCIICICIHMISDYEVLLLNISSMSSLWVSPPLIVCNLFLWPPNVHDTWGCHDAEMKNDWFSWTCPHWHVHALGKCRLHKLFSQNESWPVGSWFSFKWDTYAWQTDTRNLYAWKLPSHKLLIAFYQVHTYSNVRLPINRGQFHPQHNVLTFVPIVNRFMFWSYF